LASTSRPISVNMTVGLFDYRIRISIHSESRFRFTWQALTRNLCLMWSAMLTSTRWSCSFPRSSFVD